MLRYMRVISVAKFTGIVLSLIFIFGALQKASVHAQTVTVAPSSAKITLSTVSTTGLAVGDSVSVLVSLEAGSAQIAGGQAIVSFDKNFLSLTTTTKGAFYDNVTFTPGPNDVTINFLNNNQLKNLQTHLDNVFFQYILNCLLNRHQYQASNLIL